MEYRRFGKTGLDLPVISCGGMRFQHGWNVTEPIPAESDQNVETCVRRALELGVNHIETARGYGSSEEQLGKVLPKLKRDSYVLQTKVEPLMDVPRFVDDFEKSMSLLKADYLDLFSMHGINDQASLDASEACMETALRWKAEGRIRHIGFATHGPVDILLKAVKTGAFEYINLHYYYIFQDNAPVIEEATRRGMGVFIISPNDKGGMLYQPTPKMMELCAPLHPMVFNGLFCLSHPAIHTLSCGVSKASDFDAHMETATLSGKATESISPILPKLQSAMEEALGVAWTKTWAQGLPAWHETPGHINIPWILRLYNLAKAFDMVEFGKMRYNLLGNAGTWFPGKQAGEVASLDLSECLKNSPHASVIPEILKDSHALLAGEERKRLTQSE